MKHLIVSREYPPAPYAPGGIGTYVANIARLMAERGEIVHVIAQRWTGASAEQETSSAGRLIVHRIGDSDLPKYVKPPVAGRFRFELDGLKASAFPNQWFSWHAAFLAEHLIEQEGIDVVEGQDWEAPLYYFFLRRSLGMGPRHTPPCIVHLHSASSFIRHYNGALSTPPAYPLMKRMEEVCIRSADALLCPSHYFADQCSKQFELPRESINVIRLPIGFTPILERSSNVWAAGSICFVGRLEPRKGIIEWIEAATRVAAEDTNVHFDVVGADIWGLRSTLESRLPAAFKPRFRFHGSKSREELLPHLAGAMAAVVPSRWENFPNVCIEAMSSGLPVIATRLGGMVELIEDGRTGWLTPDNGVSGMVDGLALALRRCLAMAPDLRAAMGLAASQSVRRTCENDATVSAHIAFRADLARRGAQRSVSPARSALTQNSLNPISAIPSADRKGAGVVVRVDSIANADAVLKSVRAQTTLPRAIAVVSRETPEDTETKSITGHAGCKPLLLYGPDLMGTEAWNAGFLALRETDSIGYWLFLDAYDRLEPDFLESLERIFTRRPDVGLIGTWTLRTAGLPLLEVPLSPEPAYQLTANDVPPASAFRAQALGKEPPFCVGMPRDYDIWDVANALLAKGWLAVTLPQALARRHRPRPEIAWPEATALRAIRGSLLARLNETASQAALNLVDDYVPLPRVAPQPTTHAPGPLQGLILRCLATAIFRPRQAIRALIWRSMAVRQWIRLGGRGAAS